MSDRFDGRSASAHRRGLSRRDFLIGAGGVVLTGALAGCGSEDETATTGAGTGAAGTSAAEGTTQAAAPKQGGNFRLGVTGGGAKDIIDGQHITTKPDQARLLAGFETLLVYDREYKIVNEGLAEEVTAESPTKWIIRIREGIEFHDGKTMTADDVVYSMQRILKPEEGLFGGAGLQASLDASGVKKRDARTVELNLKRADSTVPDQLASYYNGIVPAGYTRKGKQVGTGPYTVKSFTPGQQSVHERFANYWGDPKPPFDTVTITNFGDDAARVNALLGGQLDAITDVPFGQIPVIEGNDAFKILESEGGNWLPFCMRVDQEPWNDVRVRQAFRLIVNREELLQQALAGHGRIANDIYSPFDPCYNSDLPQREQDIEQAKALLEQAGKAGLTVELTTTDGAVGMIEMSKVFAEQAKAAGVTVNVKVLDGSTFYGDQYLKWNFSSDFWGTRNFLPQVANGSIPTAPYNETHWPDEKNKRFIEMYGEAAAEVDEAKRCEIIQEMQRMEYEEGGYIIPFFNNLVDAYSAKVQGFQPARATVNLDTYARGFRTISFV